MRQRTVEIDDCGGVLAYRTEPGLQVRSAVFIFNLITDNYENITSIDFIKKLSINSYAENPPENVAYYDEVTIDAYIYKGKLYVTEIYIDGVDSQTFLEGYNNR